MNLKGKLNTNLSLKGSQAIAGGSGGGGGSTTWNQVSGKPFNTIDQEDFNVENGELNINSSSLLDGYATEQYVDDAIDNIDLSDYATKAELDAVEAEIPSLDDYATEQYVDDAIADIPATDWDNITNKPRIYKSSTITAIMFNSSDNVASGSHSVAEGNSTQATGIASHSEGISTRANSNYQHVQGKYNIADNNGLYADIVGNGYTEGGFATRRNAEATDWDGNKYLAGDVYTGVVDWSNPTQGANKLATEADLPQADGTTIVDNNGVWSAVGGGSEPDEKSIITNSQGKLEEAVPVYSEQIPISYCQMLINGQWTKGTSDWDIYITKTDATAGLSFDSSDYNYRLDLIFDLDGTNQFWYSGTWKSTTTANNQWKCDSKSDNAPDNSLVGLTQQVYYTSTAQSQGYQYRFHAWLGGKLTSYNIVGISITALYSDDEYFTEQMLTAADLPHSSVVIPEIIYHKLPKDYIDLNIVSDEVLYNGYYPMLYNDNRDNIRAYRIGSGSGISIGVITLSDGTKGYQFNNTMKESPIGGYIGTNQSTYNLQFTSENIDATHKRHYISQQNFNNLFNWAGNNKDLFFTLQYSLGTGSYYSNGPKITGVLHLGANNTDPISVEGFGGVIDSAYIDTTNTAKYFCIDYCENINAGLNILIQFFYTVSYYPAMQRVNAFWLPLDNSTIITDSNGNIKTAIPAAPTTDGTYTLQATVSNGVLTYSWI